MMTEQGQRLHSIWIIFRLGRWVKEFVIALILFGISFVSEDSMIEIMAGVVLGLYLIYRFVSFFLYWWNFRYLFTDKDLFIVEGKLKKEERFISLDRIQSVQVNRTLFHRLFGVALLSINTASIGDDSSVILEVISHEEAKRIKKYLGLIQSTGPLDRQLNIEVTLSENESVTYKMTMKEVVLSALTSLKVFALVPLVFALYSKLDDFFTLSGFVKEVKYLYEKEIGMLLLIVVIAFFISVILGIGLTYVRLGKFQVTSGEERLLVKKGILNQTEFSIQKNRVQAIKLNANILRQWLGVVEVEIVSAGGVGVDTMDEASTLFPLITKKRALDLIPDILPAFKIETNMVKLPLQALYMKLLRPSGIWLIGTVGLIYFFPKYWLISLIVLILLLMMQLLKYSHSGYQVKGSYVQLQSGMFTTELFITKRWKIDELEYSQSWLQRKFSLASLQISTRAKPVDITTLSDIPREIAVKYYHWFANRQNGIE